MTDSDDREVAGHGDRVGGDARGSQGAPVGGAVSLTAVVGATDAERVGPTLAALGGQIAPPGGWRVTVHVLTASSTVAELVDAWVARAPASRSVVPTGGHDPTWRRAALREADTDVVAFVAEGAVVPPTWVVCHARVFDRAEVAAASGSVGLCWLVARPAWWTAEYDGWLGVVEVGDHALALEPGARLSPYNASIRRTSIDAVGSETAIFDDEEAFTDAVTFVSALRRSDSYAVRVPEAPAIRQVRRDDVATTAMMQRGWFAGRRSITSDDAAVGRSALVRMWLATAEVRAATKVMGRRTTHVERAGQAIAGSTHLGRAVSLVEGDGRGFAGR